MLFAKGLLDDGFGNTTKVNLVEHSSDFVELGWEAELECAQLRADICHIECKYEGMAIRAYNEALTESALNSEFAVLKEAAEKGIWERIKSFFNRIIEFFKRIALRIRNWIVTFLKSNDKFMAEHKDSTASGTVKSYDFKRIHANLKFDDQMNVFLSNYSKSLSEKGTISHNTFPQSSFPGLSIVLDRDLNAAETRIQYKEKLMGEKEEHTWSVQELLGYMKDLVSQFEKAPKMSISISAYFEKIKMQFKDKIERKEYDDFFKLAQKFVAIYNQTVDCAKTTIVDIRFAISEIEKNSKKDSK